jgi:hypothetical protein
MSRKVLILCQTCKGEGQRLVDNYCATETSTRSGQGGIPMTRLEFRNRLCILRSIDQHELVEACAIGADDFPMWRVFVKDPVSFFVLCEDHRAEKIWRVIERRAYPALQAGRAL